MMERWPTTPLADTCAVFTDGDWVETKDQSPSGIRLIQTGNVGAGSFKNRLDKARYISTKTFDKLKCTEIREGDCLVSRLPDPVGRSCIIPDTGGRMITAVDCTIIRFKAETILPEFFRYYTQSRSYLASVDWYCTGATRRRISRKNLGRVLIPGPPFAEQERIVAILDEAFAAIATATANAEKNVANARELFESELNRVFSQKGDGWVEKKLGQACSIKHGFAFKGEFFADKGDYVVLTPGNFFETGGYRDRGGKTKFYTGEIPPDFVLAEGDFLIAMTEQAVGLLGSSMIVPESDRFLHNQRLGLVQIADGMEWHNDFFQHQFNTAEFRAAVQKTASGVKVRHTSPKKLRAIEVIFPPTAIEQKRVAGRLSQVLACIRCLESIHQQKLALHTELKQSLLHKAFTGELTCNKHAADRTLLEAGV